MNRLRVWGLSTLLSFALASLVLQSPALAQSSSWQMQQMRQQQQMQQQQAMQRQQQMQQQQAMQRQQQQMQQQQAMQRQQQMQQQQAMQRQQQIQQQQASQRQQQQYQQRQQQQTMQSQRQQQQALIQRQQQSAGSQRQNYQQRLGVQQQNQQRTYAPAQASAAIKGAANRNVTAREGRGFVSSGGVAKLTRPMTPGDIKKGFTGRVTADGRALVKYQGRVFAVPASGISGLVKKPSAQSQMVANTNRWNTQQKVAISARLRALTAQNTVVANNKLNAQQSLAMSARLKALSAQKVAAAAGNGGGRLPPANYGRPANDNTAPLRTVVNAPRAESSLQGSRLKMQLVAEQSAGVRAPTTITSFSDHAKKQMLGRDGVGVSRSAMEDAFENPINIKYQPSKHGPTFQFVGKNATVAVNADGKVTTGWANNSMGTRK